MIPEPDLIESVIYSITIHSESVLGCRWLFVGKLPLIFNIRINRRKTQSFHGLSSFRYLLSCASARLNCDLCDLCEIRAR